MVLNALVDSFSPQSEKVGLKGLKHHNWLVSPMSQAHICLPVHGALWWVLLQHSMMWLFFMVMCGIMQFSCAMHVFDVRVSSSSHPYTLIPL